MNTHCVCVLCVCACMRACWVCVCVCAFTDPSPAARLSFEFLGVEGEAGVVTRGLCASSHSGEFLACIAKTHLRVFESRTLEVLVGECIAVRTSTLR